VCPCTRIIRPRPPVDRGHRERPQLEIGLVDAGAADDLHAQTGPQVVVAAAEEGLAPVEHIVHADDRRGAECGVVGLRRQRIGGLLGDFAQRGRRPGCGRRREQGAPQLLFVQHGGAGNGRQVGLAFRASTARAEDYERFAEIIRSQRPD
jgi:hypothetical protein